MPEQNPQYFLSGDYGLIALEQSDFWSYVPRLTADLQGATFSIAGDAAEHFDIEASSGVVTFKETTTANIGDTFQIEVTAQTESLSATKVVEILVLPEGIERAIFTDEEKISGTPYTEVFKSAEEQVINSITWGGRWVTDVGKNTTLYYSFAEGKDPFEIVHGPSNWTSEEKDDVRSAIKAYENLVNIDFIEVDYSENIVSFEADYSLTETSEIANLWLWKSQLNEIEHGILGYSDVPAYSYGQPLFLELNYETTDFASQTTGKGTEAYDTILHELGHMLGLAHPFDGGEADDASVVGNYFNNTFYTIMSYTGSISSEPSLNDIKALQNIYGERNSSDPGDNHYFVIENMANANHRVWDYAGSNTIDLSGAVLPARHGDYYNENQIYQIENQHYVWFQDNRYYPTFAAEGNFNTLIATEAVDYIRLGGQQLSSSFQNVYAGAGDDQITLFNAGALDIDLGAGSDEFLLYSDWMIISELFDVEVIGGDGADYFEIHFEGILFEDGEEFTSIFEVLNPGSLFKLSLDGTGGIDTLDFDYVNKRMHGVQIDLTTETAQIANILFSIRNFERIYGTNQVDEFQGGSDPIEFFAGEGNDTIYGGAADDALYGGRGDDIIMGGLGDDLLVGDQGADTLIGGAGNDTLYVDGADTFDAGDGFDWVVFESTAIVNNTNQTFSFDVAFDSETKDYVANGILHDFDTFEVGVLEGSGGRVYGDDSSEINDFSTSAYVEFFGNAGDDEHIQRNYNYAGVEFHGGEGNDTLDLQYWVDGRVAFIEEVAQGTDTILIDKFSAVGLDIYLPANVENLYATEDGTSYNNRDHNVYGNASDNKILAPSMSNVYGGAGEDALVLQNRQSYADGGEHNDIILISSSAYRSVANGGAGDDIIFVEQDSEDIEIYESEGNDVYIFGDHPWETCLKLQRAFDEYSFIAYQDRYFICVDEEFNLIHSPSDILLFDTEGVEINISEVDWQAPDVNFIEKISASGFLNIPLGNPNDLVINTTQSRINDRLANDELFNLTRNYFEQGETPNAMLIGLNEWFSGFDINGELKGRLDLFDTEYSNKKSEILLISSEIDGFGEFKLPYSVTTYGGNWSDWIKPSVGSLEPIEVGKEFSFLLADIYVGDSTSTGYLHAASASQDELFTGNKENLNFNISGLPTGTKYDVDTGYISGSIEHSGLFNLLLTVSGKNIYAEKAITLFGYEKSEMDSYHHMTSDIVRLGEHLFVGNRWVGYDDRFRLDRLIDLDIAHVGLVSSPSDGESRMYADYTSVGKIFEDIQYTENELSDGTYTFFGLTNEGLTGKKFTYSADLRIPTLEDAAFQGEWVSADKLPIEAYSSFKIKLPEIDGVLPHYARFIDAAQVKESFESIKGTLDETTGIVSFQEWYPYASELSDDILIYALYGDETLIGSATVDFVSQPFLEVIELSIRQGHAVQHEIKLGNIDRGETYKLSLQNNIPEGVSFDPETNILTLDIENDRVHTYTDYLTFKIEQISAQGTESFSNDLKLTITDNNAPILSTAASIIINEDTPSDRIPYSAIDADQIDTLTYSFSNPQKGSITNNNDGTYNFTPHSNATGSDSFIITVNDGAEDVSQIVSVSITSENDAPVYSAANATANFVENAAVTNVVHDASTGASDVDGDALTYSIGGTDASSFDVDSASGEITFKASPNYETQSSYSLSLTATDGSGSTATQALTVTVTDANDSPVFSAATATGSVAENAVASTQIFDANSTDEDTGDTLTYSVTGTDADLVNIDASSGVITLKNSANFEAKTSYSFNVVATDGTSSATQAVTVSVTNVNEAPTITSSNSGSVKENAATNTVIYTAVATDVDAKDSISYSVSGTDAGLVNIDATSGEVTLKTSANFEAKSTYSFDVIATDAAGLTDTETVTVSVSDVNDAPSASALTSVFLSDENTLSVDANYLKSVINDVDAGDSLTITSVSVANNGIGSVAETSTGSGVWLYTPSTVTEDTDVVLDYTVSDAAGATDSSTLTVTVVDTIPLSNPVNEDSTAVQLAVPSGSDFNSATISFDDGQTAKGTFNSSNETFTPAADFNGTVNFTITLADGTTTLPGVLVVQPVNDAPVLDAASSLSLVEDIPSSPISYSATDVDGDLLTFEFTTPSKGNISRGENGTYIYTPNNDANGQDIFTITVNDGNVDVSQIVNVTIDATNDVPELTTASNITVDENTASTAINYSAKDVDGDTLQFTFGKPSKGVITTNDNGTYIYTPFANAVGADSFTVTVDDHTDATSETVMVRIIPDLRIFDNLTKQEITDGLISYNSLSGDVNSTELINFSQTNTVITADYLSDTAGAVQISDVISQLRHLVGLDTLNGIALGAADNDGDGNVDISDVISSLRVIVGLEEPQSAKLVTDLGETQFLFDDAIAELFVVAPGDADLSWAALEII